MESELGTYRRLIDPETQQELLVPTGISDERALERARRERVGELHRIRFFLDWGHHYPLWEDGTDKYAMEPVDYGVSDELGERLRAWSRFWETHYDPFEGWDAPPSEQWWLEAGDDLVDLLAVEVYDIALVLPQFRQVK
jgi:hypothetical protein